MFMTTNMILIFSYSLCNLLISQLTIDLSRDSFINSDFGHFDDNIIVIGCIGDGGLVVLVVTAIMRGKFLQKGSTSNRHLSANIRP